MFFDYEKKLSSKIEYGERKSWDLQTISGNFNKIELDLDFQRRGPWNKENRESYIESVLTGKAATNITIVNIELAKKYNEEKLGEELERIGINSEETKIDLLKLIQKQQSQEKNQNKTIENEIVKIIGKNKKNKYSIIEYLESIYYFDELKKQNKEYVSLDGNNRTTTIAMFLDIEEEPKIKPEEPRVGLPQEIEREINGEKIKIPKGTLMKDLVKGEVEVEIKNDKQGRNKKRKLTKEEGQNIYKNISENFKISFNVFNQVSRNDLNDIFLNINKQTKITKQEERNSIEGEVSQKIREIGKRFRDKDIEYKFFTEKDYDKKNAEEFFSKILLLELNSSYETGLKEISKEDLDYIKKTTDKDLDNLFMLKEAPNLKIEKTINILEIVFNFFKEGGELKNNRSELFNIYIFIKLNQLDRTNDLNNLDMERIKEEYYKFRTILFEENEGFASEIKDLSNESKLSTKYNFIFEKYQKNKIKNEVFYKEKVDKRKINKKEEEIDLNKQPKIEIEQTKVELEKTTEKRNETKEYNLVTFQKMKQQTFVDKTFQRNEVWSLKNQKEYINSLIRNEVFTDIIVADVEHSLKNTGDEYYEILSSKNIEELERKLLKYPNQKVLVDNIKESINKKEVYLPIKYVSLDGNNRSSTIMKFIKGEIIFPEMEIKNDKGEITSIKGKKYEDLEEDGFKNFKNYLDTKIQINTNELRTAKKQELNDTFLRVNEGVPVNAQEKRIAKGTKVSRRIRDLTEKYSKYFKDEQYIKTDDWKVSKDGEIITTLWYLERNQSCFEEVSNGKLDTLYNHNEIEPTIDFEKKLDIFFEILGYCKVKENVSLTDFFNVYIYISNLIDMGLEIKKENKENIYDNYKKMMKKEKEDNIKYNFYIEEDEENIEINYSQIFKDLYPKKYNKEKLMARELIIQKVSNNYIKEYKKEIPNKDIKEFSKQISEYYEDLKNNKDIKNKDKEELFYNNVKKILENLSEVERNFLYEELLINKVKIKKKVLKNIINNKEYNETVEKIIKPIFKDNEKTLEEILEEINIEELNQETANEITEGIIQNANNTLKGGQKSDLTEMKAWLITFIKYDFEEFKKIVSEVYNNSENIKNPYMELNKKIHQRINERSMIVRGGNNIESPFEIPKEGYNIKFKKQGSGNPDLIYFPIEKNISVVGCSATASSEIKWEGTQIIRHPKRINKLKTKLLEDVENKKIDIEEYLKEIKKEKPNEEYKSKINLYIKILKTQGEGDESEIIDIIEELEGIPKEKRIEKLDEIYGFNLKEGRSEYVFLGDINQSIMKNDEINNSKEVLMNEVIEMEKKTIDMFLFAQKGEMKKKMGVSTKEKDEIKEELFNYIYKNIINIITKSGVIISEKNDRLSEEEMVKIIIEDVYIKKNIEETTYLKFLKNKDIINQNKQELIEKMILNSLNYLERNIKEEKVKKMIDQILEKYGEKEEPSSTFNINDTQIREKIEQIKTMKEKIKLEDSLAKTNNETEMKEKRFEIIQEIRNYIEQEENTLEEYVDSEVFTMEEYEKYRIKAEEEIFWSKIPGLKSIKLKKEYKKRLLSLPEFIVDKYFSKSEDEEKVRTQINGMRNNKLERLAEATEEELEKEIQELLKKENIDITQKDSERLKEEIKKTVRNKFQTK